MESATISFPIFGEGFVINVPNSISIFGFSIYLYGLFLTAGFAAAALYMYKRRDMLGLTQDNVLDLVIMAVPCGIVGARIYFAIFNFSSYFGPGNWLNIFRIREGGLAVYGGVIGGVVAFYVYSRIKKVPIGKLLDAAGFGLFLGQAVGRWGNFFNREAYGVATDLPWRMGLTLGSRTTYVHPTFLYESLWNTAGLILMHIFSKRNKSRYYGQYFLCYVAWYGFGRYLIEGLRTDSLFISGTDIRISQLLAALSFSVAVVLLIRNHFRVKQGLLVCDQGSEVSDQETDDSGQETAITDGDTADETAVDEDAENADTEDEDTEDKDTEDIDTEDEGIVD